MTAEANTTGSLTRPIVWTIAGSDTGGGAGIQADLKTMNALGAHGCSVITALTAQNTTGVARVEYSSPEMLAAQLQALQADLPPVALKLGMLGAAEAIATVAKTLGTLDAFVICDPVMVSTSGHALSEPASIRALQREIFPRVDLLTPNLVEAETLLNRAIRTPVAIEQAARDLLAMGAKAVLIKGGHAALSELTASLCQDYWTDGQSSAWLHSPRQASRHTHGTGCTLSAAIAACHALGYAGLDAVVIAKAYVNQGIRRAPGLGLGSGPLAHLGWPETFEDLPWYTPTAEAGLLAAPFPDCGPEPLGFYPVVPRAEWLERLLPEGVRTVQLRIKDLSGEALEAEIARACAMARSFEARLFINDHWALALKHGAYGVHLGQEDLETADLDALRRSGVRLGVSTHCYREVSRALAVRPSYIAVGPVFHTTTKALKFAPQGLAAVRRWRRSLPYPLVAIAGIFLDNAPEVLATGVDGLAVVRDITQAQDVPAQVRRWLALFESHAAIVPSSLSVRSAKAGTRSDQLSQRPVQGMADAGASVCPPFQV